MGLHRQESGILRKKHDRDAGRYILWAFFSAFVFLGILNLISLRMTAIDCFTAAFFIGLALLLSLRHNVSAANAFFIGLVLVPSTVGNMGGYGMPILGYNFDKIVHILTALLLTASVILFILNNSRNAKFIRIAGLAVVVTVASGTIVEISEYWGFRLIGLGEGYMGFGAGDNSKNFGPWEDSSLDMTFNVIGSLAGVLFSYIFILVRRKTCKRLCLKGELRQG